MTRFPLTDDPGAARTAKNDAAPGLPNQPAHDTEGRNPMVGTTTSPYPAPAPEPYAQIGALLARQPVRTAAPSERAYQAARVSWLFELAAALVAAGLGEDAGSVRDTALRLVHTAVNEIAEQAAATCIHAPQE